MAAVNGIRLEDQDDSQEALDAVSTHVEDLLAVQQRLLGDARAVSRHLARLDVSLTSPEAAFPPPPSMPAALRAMREVIEHLSRDRVRLAAMVGRAGDRAAVARGGEVPARRTRADVHGVAPSGDQPSDAPSSDDG